MASFDSNVPYLNRDPNENIFLEVILNTTSIPDFDMTTENGITVPGTSTQNPQLIIICGQLARYNQFRFVIDVFVVGVLIIAGLIGNTLTIMVMRADNMNNTVSFLMQALAVADNVYLIACIFMQTIKALTECNDWIPGLKDVYPYMEPYVWPCASIAQTTTVWLVVLITLDRYVAICHPFNTSYMFTTKRMKKAVVVIVILAFLYNIPRFFEHQTMIAIEHCQNRYKLTSTHTELRKNRNYIIIYKTCFYFLFRVVIPLGTLSILNTKLILALKGATQNHAVLTRTSPQQDSYTRILVVVVTVFMICEVPSFLVRTIVTIKAFTGLRVNLWYYATVTNLLLTVNSSVNCLIYCVSGRRFRKILKRLFCRMCVSGKHRRLVLVGDEVLTIGNSSYTRQGTVRTTVRRSFSKNDLNVSISTCNKETKPLTETSM